MRHNSYWRRDIGTHDQNTLELCMTSQKIKKLVDNWVLKKPI